MNNTQLTGAQLVACLKNTPQAQVARMGFEQQCALLQRVCFGEATVTEPFGAALLEALRLRPEEVGTALAHVEEIKRKNVEGRAAWLRLQEIEETLKPLIEELTAKAVETFGPEWELIRPPVFYVDWFGDAVVVQNAPVLQPLADAVTAAMQGRAAIARVAQMIEQQLDVRDLLALAGRRREAAGEAARKVS